MGKKTTTWTAIAGLLSATALVGTTTNAQSLMPSKPSVEIRLQALDKLQASVRAAERQRELARQAQQRQLRQERLRQEQARQQQELARQRAERERSERERSEQERLRRQRQQQMAREQTQQRAKEQQRLARQEEKQREPQREPQTPPAKQESQAEKQRQQPSPPPTDVEMTLEELLARESESSAAQPSSQPSSATQQKPQAARKPESQPAPPAPQPTMAEAPPVPEPQQKPASSDADAQPSAPKTPDDKPEATASSPSKKADGGDELPEPDLGSLTFKSLDQTDSVDQTAQDKEATQPPSGEDDGLLSLDDMMAGMPGSQERNQQKATAESPEAGAGTATQPAETFDKQPEIPELPEMPDIPETSAPDQESTPETKAPTPAMPEPKTAQNSSPTPPAAPETDREPAATPSSAASQTETEEDGLIPNLSSAFKSFIGDDEASDKSEKQPVTKTAPPKSPEPRAPAPTEQAAPPSVPAPQAPEPTGSANDAAPPLPDFAAELKQQEREQDETLPALPGFGGTEASATSEQGAPTDAELPALPDELMPPDDAGEPQASGEPQAAGEQELASLPDLDAPESADTFSRDLLVGASPDEIVMQVKFAKSETEVPLSYQQRLINLSKSLREHPEVNIKIVAYASGSDDQRNIASRVSLTRALAIRGFLIDLGIDNVRISVQALGNKTEKGPKERADIYVLNEAKSAGEPS